MHELSIARNIVEIVRQNLPENGTPKVVAVRVGDFSGVVPESLEFSFQAITQGTALADTQLAIDRVPAILRCDACRTESPIADPILICSRCGGSRTQLLSGTELQVVSIELADHTPETS